MTEPIRTEIAVIGAGVIGLAIAERLVAEGREVTLVDPGEPGMGASYGNAGTIADYAVMPVGSPDVLKNLPSLLFDRSSPLSIRRAAIPSLMPWLARFAWQSRPGPTARNAAAIARLLAGHVGAKARIVTARAERIERRVDGVMVTGAGLSLHARKVVLAAGAHSRALAAQAGDRVPLDTERGYHVEWDMQTPRLTRPSCPTSRGFYLCPMQGRLRVAGTVELGGLAAPPSAHRIAKLVEGARAIFPDLPEPSREWMGFRPSVPDSVPVIGPSAKGGDILHAYGHGHIGLTLAPITARIVASLIMGRDAELDLAPYLPSRF